jgi:hypothetical protein
MPLFSEDEKHNEEGEDKENSLHKNCVVEEQCSLHILLRFPVLLCAMVALVLICTNLGSQEPLV